MRMEQAFHDQIWRIANDSMRLESAVDSARQVMELVINGEADALLIQTLADNWMDRFGGDEYVS